jgi:hypothetical protein
MRARIIGCVGFLIVALGMQTNLLGQAVTGTLLGTVLDPTGAVVPNANVTLTNEGTGVSNHMPTSAQGFFTFPTLDPGRYSVAVLSHPQPREGLSARRRASVCSRW